MKGLFFNAGRNFFTLTKYVGAAVLIDCIILYVSINCTFCAGFIDYRSIAGCLPVNIGMAAIIVLFTTRHHKQPHHRNNNNFFHSLDFRQQKYIIL